MHFRPFRFGAFLQNIRNKWNTGFYENRDKKASENIDRTNYGIIETNGVAILCEWSMHEANEHTLYCNVNGKHTHTLAHKKLR